MHMAGLALIGVLALGGCASVVVGSAVTGAAIGVGQERGVVGVIDDVDDVRGTWITTQIRTKLIFDDQVSSANVRIETVDGVVYLIGRACSREERDAILTHACAIQNAERSDSHVCL